MTVKTYSEKVRKAQHPPRKVRGGHQIHARDKATYTERGTDKQDRVTVEGKAIETARCLVTVRAGKVWEDVSARYLDSRNLVQEDGITQRWDITVQTRYLPAVLTASCVAGWEYVMSNAIPGRMGTTSLPNRSTTHMGSAVGHVISRISKREHRAKLAEILPASELRGWNVPKRRKVKIRTRVDNTASQGDGTGIHIPLAKRSECRVFGQTVSLAKKYANKHG